MGTLLGRTEGRADRRLGVASLIEAAHCFLMIHGENLIFQPQTPGSKAMNQND